MASNRKTTDKSVSEYQLKIKELESTVRVLENQLRNDRDITSRMMQDAEDKKENRVNNVFLWLGFLGVILIHSETIILGIKGVDVLTLLGGPEAMVSTLFTTIGTALAGVGIYINPTTKGLKD